ncbi:hypothetical protein KIW84_060153 [Lathyrus oleraceus]|uniref:Uncharacterized protein n=1 Tax=Pisum sativum TaxID=3888 RepID=A0A9D4W0K5_PEA|nr:hypothetical protein KIW84_060153 [Pisum sativum]
MSLKRMLISEPDFFDLLSFAGLPRRITFPQSDLEGRSWFFLLRPVACANMTARAPIFGTCIVAMAEGPFPFRIEQLNNLTNLNLNATTNFANKANHIRNKFNTNGNWRGSNFRGWRGGRGEEEWLSQLVESAIYLAILQYNATTGLTSPIRVQTFHPRAVNKEIIMHS